MINTLNERLISFAEASKLFPLRRRGKKPSISCLYRWTSRGCKGVILESVQAGGSRCTSREAVGRFLDRMTEAHGPTNAVCTSTSRQRERQMSQAEKFLDDEGV